MTRLRVAILGIEPIEPPEGGSRLRLLGLHHALGPDVDATYVGAFHWRGPERRHVRHGPRLAEITVPFAAEHLDAIDALSAEAGGANVIDASFPRLGALSEAFADAAREAAARADVVVFSHPWAFAVAGDAVQPDRQLVVYDAHNVEAVRWRALLGATAVGRELAEEVAKLEATLCHAADLVLACSHEDRQALVSLHRISHARTRVVPNGVFAGRIRPAEGPQRARARARLGVGDGAVALFIGGLYPPNVEAAEHVRDELAPACPDVTFVLLGHAGRAAARGRSPAQLPANLRIVGGVDESTKLAWLHAADLGVNPMSSGFGTNIKMLDYMAAGLPVATTPTGARGIDGPFAVAEKERLAERVSALAASPALRARLGRRGREVVARRYDWSNLSAELGATLRHHAARKGRAAPFFSVTVATLDRPAKLRRLLDLLASQDERDFEVIVVDQSDEPARPAAFGLDLTVLHTPVRGAARARNLAASVARGRVVAFVDDDCEPPEHWLREARAALEGTGAVGLEGRVTSAREGDPHWRVVKNDGVEGLGFMSCNLFADAESFHAVGGFDLAFDEHDFRYDTDLGWQLQEIGDVPFSEEAFVHHPPWPRTIERESQEARDRFFEGDALLMRKHPERYPELLLAEGHWLRHETFAEHLERGARRHGVTVPDGVRARLDEARASLRASAPMPIPRAAEPRRRSLLANALEPDSARTRFLTDLRRARRSKSVRPPTTLDLRGHHERMACARRNWWLSPPDGIWTRGPFAQLLIVPDDPPSDALELGFELAEVSCEPHETVVLGIDVNGVVGDAWRLGPGPPAGPPLRLVAPAAAFEGLSACLVTFRIEVESAREAPIQPSVVLRHVSLRPIAAAGDAP